MSRVILFCLIAIVLASCAPAPTPTVAPTAKPTEVPKPTVAPIAAPTIAPTPVPTTAPTVAKRDLGREKLAPNDGWAAEGKGTTGGAAVSSQ